MAAIMSSGSLARLTQEPKKALLNIEDDVIGCASAVHDARELHLLLIMSKHGCNEVILHSAKKFSINIFTKNCVEVKMICASTMISMCYAHSCLFTHASSRIRLGSSRMCTSLICCMPDLFYCNVDKQCTLLFFLTPFVL